MNLNTDGSLQQADTSHSSLLKTFITSSLAQVTPPFAANTLPAARGQGFGPAEIDLTAVLGNSYQQVLGTSSSEAGGYQGRYGTNWQPGGGTSSDLLDANNWFEYGQKNYWSMTGTNMVNNAGSYGSPPDPFGVGAVGLDQAGRPLYCGFNYLGNTSRYVGFGSSPTNNPNTLAMYDRNVGSNPYELNLGPNAARGVSSAPNNLFSPAELERLLRPYDRDAPSLPARLATLAPNLLPTAANPVPRLKVTTESWDVPGPATPSLQFTTAPVNAATKMRVVDLLKNLLMTGGSLTTETQAMQVLPQLLPPELFVGLKMNINRPLGNGQDAVGNKVVDDPSATTNQSVTLSGQTVSTFSFDGDGIGGTNSPATSLAARQLEARYLYVLVFTLANRAKLQTAFGSVDKAAQAVAQWAINAVDFRCRDNIMTQFDYDPSFAAGTASGWNPQGVGKGGACTVWGCKRPQLLISETLAFHDRRTQDTKDEVDPSATEGDDGKVALYYNNTGQPHDASFDQSYRPQGSLFVELYNPSSPWEPQSGDFCPASNGTWALSLTQTSSSGSGPVAPGRRSRRPSGGC